MFTSFPKFNLKFDNDLQFTKSAGSKFHSVIDLGKKEADIVTNKLLVIYLLNWKQSVWNINVIYWI